MLYLELVFPPAAYPSGLPEGALDLGGVWRAWGQRLQGAPEAAAIGFWGLNMMFGVECKDSVRLGSHAGRAVEHSGFTHAANL